MVNAHLMVRAHANKSMCVTSSFLAYLSYLYRFMKGHQKQTTCYLLLDICDVHYVHILFIRHDYVVILQCVLLCNES